MRGRGIFLNNHYMDNLFFNRSAIFKDLGEKLPDPSVIDIGYRSGLTHMP
jgi:hypothetical protein